MSGRGNRASNDQRAKIVASQTSNIDCTKRRFPSKGQALGAARAARRDGRVVRGVYRCPICDWWHTTKSLQDDPTSNLPAEPPIDMRSPIRHHR